MTPWTGEAASLADRIARFVDGALAGAPPEPFEGLALDVHRWQVGQDRVLAALVDGPADRATNPRGQRPADGPADRATNPRGQRPADGPARHWTEIPAVPVATFRALPVGTFRAGQGGPGQGGVVFRTSGTTTGARGEHHLRSTALYDRGAIGWARRCVPGIPTSAAALLEDPAKTPDSSLSHMVASFGPTTWHQAGGVLDVDGLNRRISGSDRPLFVAATGFALADWLERGPARLPDGSVLMVTGGFKGRRVELEAPALYAHARDALRPGRFVTEYGMTELSSQLWGTPDLPYLPPPWLKVVAVDPEGRPVPAGERGQLRFYDLCNLDGTVGVETMDEGVVRPDGGVELIGRLTGAEARGCSLTVEEAWGP